MLLSNFSGFKLEAGCDEAGRGCLAGPVYAASVILPPDFSNSLLNDSKQLSEKKRYQLREIIIKEAISYSVAFASAEEIDQMNILQASFLAMHRAIEKLNTLPEFLVIDGNRFKPFKHINHQCIVKGDSKYLNIAAASILAKTFRDDFMLEQHQLYPEYNWHKNKGYPTADHRKAIEKYGLSPIHRKSFRQLPVQLELSFK
jgi:ribonuclease HII